MPEVLHISRGNWQGGAARAAYHLHQQLRHMQVDSQMLVLENSTGDVYSHPPQGQFSRLRMRMAPLLDQLPLRLKRQAVPEQPWSNNFLSSGLLKTIRRLDPAIIHLHWIGGGLLSISELARPGKPIVWTLHDLWALTGGCHHPFDCDHFARQCGQCPQLGSTSPQDTSYKNLRRKMQLPRNNSYHFIAPGSWVANQFARSFWSKYASCSVIPSGVDTNFYQPGNQNFARKLWNLPDNKKIILFCATSATTNPYKGFATLYQVAKDWPASQLMFVVAGSNAPADFEDQRFRFLGPVQDMASMKALYQAADVLAFPSVVETQGLVVAEAAACGLATVAFPAGNLPDWLEHRKSAYLARQNDGMDFLRGLQWTLQQGRSKKMGSLARRVVTKELSLSACADQVNTIYKNIKQ